MFMNHFKIMSRLTSLVFAESGIYYNIANDFGRVQLAMIDTVDQDPDIATSPEGTVKKLNYCGLYTCLFNSSE